MRKLLPFLFLLFAANVHAQQKDPFRNKALVLKRFFEKNHYQPIDWNDSSSIMLFDKWLSILDDDKLFFTQNEMNFLNAYRTKLDDELSGKSWEFFDRSFALYQASLKRADSITEKLFSKPIDISKPDNITWPLKDYATGVPELAKRWQQYIKWQVLGSVADDMLSNKKTITNTLPPDFAVMENAARLKRKKLVKNNLTELLQTPAELLQNMQDNYLNSIAWCYDPHSNYMSISKKKEWDTEISASAYTVGFDVEKNDKGDIAISYLQPGGSAWRSGQLHKGDVLVKIKENGHDHIVEDMDEDDLDGLLSGNNASDIEVTIRTAAGEVTTVKLSKEKVSDEESIVKSYVIRDKKNIGYISLPGFYSREEDGSVDPNYNGCANDVSKEIVKLKKDSIAGLILDLRYNGGGRMWEGMQLAGIFIDAGPVGSEKDKDGKVHFLKDPNRGTIYDGPLIVLINGASASASEFVAAALQDYNRAIIMGGTSYGKGTAQIVLPMDTLQPRRDVNYTDFVKVTGEKFYRINGGTTQWKGVVPDIEWPDIYGDESFKEKFNASALKPDNSKIAMYQPLSVLPVSSLKTNSLQRISKSDYFNGIQQFSNWFKERREGRTIPLQWDTYTDHFKKATSMFELLKEKDNKADLLRVSNNGFDQQQIDQSGEQRKKVNGIYLHNIATDNEILEACKVIGDWISK